MDPGLWSPETRGLQRANHQVPGDQGYPESSPTVSCVPGVHESGAPRYPESFSSSRTLGLPLSLLLLSRRLGLAIPTSLHGCR